MEFTTYIEEELIKYKSKIDHINKLKELHKVYPSMKKEEFNGTLHYTASEINGKVDHCSIFVHPSLCFYNDPTPVLAQFYKEVDGVKIYADPLNIQIGMESDEGWVWPDDNWENIFEIYNLPAHFKEKIQKYLEDYAYDEEEDGLERIVKDDSY